MVPCSQLCPLPQISTPPLRHLIITLRISLLQSNFSLFARLPAPQMSVEKHIISSVAWTGLRRECLRPVACLPAPLYSVCFYLAVEQPMSSIRAHAIFIQFFCTVRLESLVHRASPSVSLFLCLGRSLTFGMKRDSLSCLCCVYPLCVFIY